MNAPVRLFVNARRSASTACLLAGASLLAGCIGNPLRDAQVDPASPIAAEVARTARMNTDFPSFSEIPAKPNDLRPVKLYGVAAHKVEMTRAQLERDTAPDTWTLNDTQSFAQSAAAAAGPEAQTPGRADTDAFADILRKRATPPPPTPR